MVLDRLNRFSFLEMAIKYGGGLVFAIAVLAVGLKLINLFTKHLNKRLTKYQMDPSLKSFVGPFIDLVLKILLAISVAGMLGIEMTSFVAILGAFSLAIGLAFQGSLSNFAGGVLILILKPFKVGDFIEANGYLGTVKEIQIFYTILATPDNKKVIIPNSSLSNSSAVNYSAYQTRRVDFKFGVDYSVDIGRIKAVLTGLAKNHPLVLQDKRIFVEVGQHGDYGFVIYMRLWCKSGDYWALYYDMMGKVKEAFDKENIPIPYPQLDVHLRDR